MLDQVNSGIWFSWYHDRAAAPSLPLMLIHPLQGGSACSARLKFGLLTVKGCCPLVAAYRFALSIRSWVQLEPPITPRLPALMY